ncbi:MAG: AAA family ATPase, partial [Bacteroidota bacterium]
MYIERSISTTIQAQLAWYPILYIGGPRQSGKTTLLRTVFPEKVYFNLEVPEVRALAETDPRRFLDQLPAGGIIDEAQRVPILFSYLQ